MVDYSLAQLSVLGSMLIDAKIVGDVVTRMSPNDFMDPVGKKVFLALRDLYLDGAPIDPVAALERMDGDQNENRKYLLRAMDETPTAANYQAYMDIVKRETRLRRIQSIGLSLASNAMSLDQAAPLVAELNALMVEKEGVECLTMEQGILDFYDELERKPEYLTWGLDFLNAGLTAETGDFVVLGGYPSDGKTALALSMAYAQAEKKRVGFFSLETKNSKLFSRLFSSVANVSGKRIKHRTLESEDFFRLERKVDEIKHRNLYLIKASSMSVEDIRSYARSRQFDVIYVDYLQLINDDAREEFQRVTNISKGLHRLAQDDEVMVVALSQLSRSGDKKPSPTMSSLRSSGQIEQDADIVMFIYREEPGKMRSRRILRVAKNKEGELGQIALLFRGDTQTFSEDHTGVPIKEPTEPEAKQQAFFDLPGSEKVPWEDGYHNAG